MMFQHGGKVSGKSGPCRMSNVLKSTQFFLDLVPTFLKKGALKLQKGAHFTRIGQFLVWETAHLPLP